MQNPATLYIVRHGQTDWNAAFKVQGQIDIPLNEIGEQQAQEAAEKLKDIEFAAAFSSDLVRAKRTAEIITLEKDIAVQVTKLIRERNFGVIEGEQLTELRAKEKELEHLAYEERFRYKMDPSVENDEELIGRFLTFLREIAVAYADKNVLVVTHGGLMRAVLVHLGYATYQNVRHLRVGNTGIIKLVSDGVELEIQDTENIYFEES